MVYPSPPDGQEAAPDPARESGPLFSFAHEAMPDPHDAVLANAFEQAAARNGPAQTPLGTHGANGAPELKPHTSLSTAPDLDADLETTDDLEKNRDQGLGF